MSFYSKLYGAYTRLQGKVCPELRSAQQRFEGVLEEEIRDGVDWLDVGCGWHLLREWQESAERELVGRARMAVGVDLDEEAIRKHRTIPWRALGDAGDLPFADATFDLVTANMVVEHLDAPGEQFAEIRRVLKPGGVFLFHTPNLSGYIARIASLLPEWTKGALVATLERRKAADVYPTFYLANTAEDIVRLSRSAGLEVARIDHVTTVAQTAVVLPLALLELAWLRRLERDPKLERFRTNLIVQLRRPVEA